MGAIDIPEVDIQVNEINRYKCHHVLNSEWHYMYEENASNVESDNKCKRDGGKSGWTGMITDKIRILPHLCW